MQNEAIPDPIQDRNAALTQLFVATYGEIHTRLASYQWEILPITVMPVEDVIQALAGRIHQYPGALAEPAFIEWAVELAIEPVKIRALYDQYNRAVYKGVSDKLKASCMDLVATAMHKRGTDYDDQDNHELTFDQLVRYIAGDAWTNFVLLEKISLLKSGGPRLAAFFKTIGSEQVRAWRTEELRRRAQISLDDSRFQTIGRWMGEAPRDQSDHPYHAGPNDNLDGLLPEEPKPKTPRKPKPGAKPTRKYVRRPNAFFSSFDGVIVLPAAAD